MGIMELQAIQPQMVKPVQRTLRQKVFILRSRLRRARGLELGEMERDIRQAEGQLAQTREKP